MFLNGDFMFICVKLFIFIFVVDMELKVLCVLLYSDIIDFEDMKKYMMFWNNSEVELEL